MMANALLLIESCWAMIEYFPGVDLVVVNYQTPLDLERFLQSYEDVEIEIPHSLHVVNVCPTDADRHVATNAGVPFLYNEWDTNIGYARACNRASEWSDRKVMAFFNADTELRVGVVEYCYDWLKYNNNTAVVGPKQVDEGNRITHAGIAGTFQTARPRGWHELDRGQYDAFEDCVSVSGSAYFIKHDVFDELAACPDFLKCPQVAALRPEGAFLPTRHYYEETYLSYHAWAHGYKVTYLGLTKMIHRWHRASPVGSVEAEHLHNSRALFRAACDYHGIPHD